MPAAHKHFFHGDWMVKKIGENFQCGECKLLYREKSMAEKCQAWCKENNSCNLEITKHAIKGMGF